MLKSIPLANAVPLAPRDGRWDPGAAQLRSEPAARAQGRSDTGAVLTLVTRLEQLLAGEMTAQQRIALLMLLEPQIAALAGGLAKPVAHSRHRSEPRPAGLTLEQRLYQLAAQNLARGIESLDKSPQAFSDQAADQRWWLVKQLFRALGRGIEYCFRWDRAWPPEVWEACHDLYFYLVSRPDLRLGSGYERGSSALDPQGEYKRLLLLGLAHDRVGLNARAAILGGPLREWAEESRLRDPGGFDGAFGVYVVEIARDLPPWEYPVALGTGFRGWVFQPAPSFLDRLAELGRGLESSPPVAGLGNRGLGWAASEAFAQPPREARS